jgi:hypothetical protein
VIAETLRIGLFELYHREGGENPVHPLSLRSWVRHKLGPVIPHVLEEGEDSFREVLCEGRGANLEFMGDAILLFGGYLCPAPTRLVQAGPNSFLVVSGLPSDRLGALGQNLVHDTLGRRVEGLESDRVRALGIPIQTLDEYLGNPAGIQTPEELMGKLLLRSRNPWRPGTGWQIYLGNLELGVTRTEAQYGFKWIDPNDRRYMRPVQTKFQGVTVSVWREPLTDRFFHYWMKGSGEGFSFGIRVENSEWKQVCLAFDFLSGEAREATFVRDPRRSGVTLSIGFQPFEALYRALHALGAKFVGWRPGMAEWELRLDARELVGRVLERSGVRVHVLGS